MQGEQIRPESIITGKVKWFNDVKGFGFIEHSSGKDVFVHFSVIETAGFKSLKEGEEVEYELDIRDRGYFAKKVTRTNKLTATNETSIITIDEMLPINTAALNSNNSLKT